MSYVIPRAQMSPELLDQCSELSPQTMPEEIPALVTVTLSKPSTSAFASKRRWVPQFIARFQLDVMSFKHLLLC
jgi:hypothetical protein